MDKITELREKRTKAWNKAKAFRPEDEEACPQSGCVDREIGL